MFRYGKQSSCLVSPFSTPCVPFKKSKTLPESASTRVACKAPFKILDAPNLQDDFYLNLVDWSSQNMLAVALNNSVYLWNGGNNKVSKLLENSQNISSINWNKSGCLMSVGLDNGGV